MKKILFAISLVTLLGSCYNDKFDKLYPLPPAAVNFCDTAANPARFRASVNNIITAKCASPGCHNPSTQQSGFNFTTHSADSAASGRIKARVFASSNAMPPSTSPQLSDCEKGQILNWINNGSRNN